MDFMAHQGQLRNSIIAILFMLSGIACEHSGEMHADKIPATYKSANSNQFQIAGGRLYFDKQLFSGWKYLTDMSGDTIFLQSFIDGKPEGSLKWFDTTGKIIEDRLFINGKKEGTHKCWWANGNLKFEYNYKNDLFDGEVKEWFEDGVLYRSFNYSKGQELGLQQQFSPTGKIYANYVVMDGRKYGLTGTKHCKSKVENEIQL